MAVALAETVTFTYHDPAAKEVQIAGDYFSWGKPTKMKRAGGLWTTQIQVPADARVEYKFIVDGNWILDPKNPKHLDNGVGGENSVWEGPKYRLQTLETAPKKPLLRSTLRVKDRDITVFSPAQSKGLPLLVYGDGPNYEKYAKVQNVVQNLVEARKIKPVVIVLVPPTDRIKEYGTGWKTYGEYLFNEVLPAVRKQTGASARKEDLFLGGSSMGGLISLRLAEEFPDKVAGGVHSQSGAFQWGPFGLNMTDVISEKSLAKLDPKLKLWLCWGTYEQELTESNVKAAATLKIGKRAFGSKTTNEGHTWTAWRGRMADALIYLLKR